MDSNLTSQSFHIHVRSDTTSTEAMVEITDTEKHVTFDDDDDDNQSSSSISSEDHEHGELEVTFDAGKTHRRKSSIDVLHVAMPAWKQPKQQQTSCIVHHLLQGQQRDLMSASSLLDEEAEPSIRQPSSSTASQSAFDHHLAPVQEVPSPPESEEAAGPTPQMTRYGRVKPRALSTGNIGQPDERAWANQTGHTVISCDDIDTNNLPSVATPPDQAALNSRLLTKRQLSDMAWGVRELSRRLGTLRLKPKVRSLFILTKIHDRDLIPKTRELTLWLLSPERERRYVVYVEDKLKDSKRFDADGLIRSVAKEYAAKTGMDEATCIEKVSKQLRYWNTNLCLFKPHSIDFIITLGGDGTVLYASWLFQSIVPPVISFSLGSLGFLTKFDFAYYDDILTTAFVKGVSVSLRLRFESTVMRSIKRKPIADDPDHPDETEEEFNRRRDLIEELIGEENDDEHTHRPDGKTFEVLNEIVVDRGPNPTLSSLDLFGDDEHFTSILADGICVSTPTGSTAYNLAAGGSLCHPENPIMLVTSICPHTLSFRPIILPDTIVLRIGVPYDSRTSSWASFDGRERVELHPGDYVTISASRYPFATVQAGGRRSEDWIKSISGKLGWNTRQKQKRFQEWEKGGK